MNFHLSQLFTTINSTFTINVIKCTPSHIGGFVELGTQTLFMNIFQNLVFLLDFPYAGFVYNLCCYCSLSQIM